MPKSPPTVAFSDLKPNPENPRRMSDAARARMNKSLAEFGDLSGLVHNRRTGLMVGGHQRLEWFKADSAAKIVITHTPPKPDACGTVAQGYVEAGGTRHAYREVDWAPRKETAAMIAANRHGGEFDPAGLSELLAGLGKSFDYDLTGFDVDALTELGVLPADADKMTPEEARKTLREQFGVPPFTVLDARQGYWQDRKRAWIATGIKSELGRGQQAGTSRRAKPGEKPAYNQIKG
jgi:hypothetical protein